MSDWHEDLTDEEIKRLKNLCFCWADLMRIDQDALGKIPPQDLIMRMPYGDWQVVGLGMSSVWTPRPGLTYRLRPDWKRPEKEKPKEQGRWEYCEVTKSIDGERYCLPFSTGVYSLVTGFSLVGFGGVEFEEAPGQWHMGLGLWDDVSYGVIRCDYSGMGSPRYKPATPKRCRFWIEGEK